MNSVSSIGSGLQYSVLGIQRGVANADRDAEVVAGASASPDRAGSDAVIGALLDANQQALNVAASARALSIQDQVLGSLIDIKI